MVPLPFLYEKYRYVYIFVYCNAGDVSFRLQDTKMKMHIHTKYSRQKPDTRERERENAKWDEEYLTLLFTCGRAILCKSLSKSPILHCVFHAIACICAAYLVCVFFGRKLSQPHLCAFHFIRIDWFLSIFSTTDTVYGSRNGCARATKSEGMIHVFAILF